jgi:hypothetical protein
MKKVLTVFLTFSVVFFAQSEKKSGSGRFLRFGYQAGKVLPTHEFLKGENATGQPIDYFQSFRLEYGWQTDGSAQWHHVFNFPTYGIGVYTVDFFDDVELGTPSAVYGFFDWPFKRYKKSALSAEFGFGLAYDWQPFEPEDNPYNLVIGMGRSVYIDVGLKYTYQISDYFDLSGEISFSHFSNGSTQQPNAGVNLVAPRVNLAYNFGGRKILPAKKSLPEYTADERELTFSLTYGSKSQVFEVKNFPPSREQYDSLKRDSFNVFALIATYNKRFYYNSKVGLGAEVEYDQSLGVEYKYVNGAKLKIDSDTKDKIRAGVFAQYSLVINRLEGLVGIGYYVYGENPGSLPKIYQRLGAKYYVLKRLSLGVNLRFYDFSKADNMEFNIGYKIELTK